MGEIQCNLQGVGIGNGYVSGMDFIVSWAPLFFQMSLIDDVQYKIVDEFAWEAYRYTENGNWTEYDKIRVLNSILSVASRGKNPYNIIQLEGPWSIYTIDIDDFINGPIRKKLWIIPDDIQ